MKPAAPSTSMTTQMAAATTGTSSLSQLWITRAEKILNQINHLYSLLEFVEYGCNACNRQLNLYKPRLLKNKTEETHFTASQNLIREMTSLFELY